MSAACLLSRSNPLPRRHRGKHHVPGLAFGWGHATCIQYLLLPTFSLAQGQWPGPAPGLIQLIPKAPHTEQPVGLQRSGETSRKFTASGYLQGILPPIATAFLHSFSRLLQVLRRFTETFPCLNQALATAVHSACGHWDLRRG